ncbi:MAG: hypothetical protein KF745_06940 [Phycisphaeraceae bacterium]|nr:hypothetical protein [Phycisphaeraceae bacterium]
MPQPSQPRQFSVARRTGLAAVVLAAFAILAGAMAPEPDPVPRRWQLDVAEGPMRVISLSTPGTGPRTYLYFTYTVTNNSPDDQLFAPSFELASTAGDLIRSGRNVPVDVTRQIVESLENPMVQDQIKIIGELRRGEENAKTGVIIFEAGSMAPAELTLYGAGFSGETAKVKTPGQAEEKTLRKTLMIRYRVPGTLVGQGSTPLEVIEKRWIMR